MKTILVDAINGFVDEQGNIDQEMYEILNTYENEKIILTGANDEQLKQFGLDKMPWPVFTLKHNPEKTDPQYFKIFLEQHNLGAEDVVYFEHNADAVKSAKEAGINTYFYDHKARDLVALKNFLDTNI